MSTKVPEKQSGEENADRLRLQRQSFWQIVKFTAPVAGVDGAVIGGIAIDFADVAGAVIISFVIDCAPVVSTTVEGVVELTRLSLLLSWQRFLFQLLEHFRASAGTFGIHMLAGFRRF